MHYVVETRYVGPNEGQPNYVDLDVIEIRTRPAKTNSSGEERIEGWCGTTGDYSVNAHGAFETIEQAREAIGQKFGKVRDREIESGELFQPDEIDREETGTVEVYKPGAFQPMGKEDTDAYFHDSFKDDITAETTDEQLDALEERYRAEIHEDGYEPTGLADLMEEYRDGLREGRD